MTELASFNGWMGNDETLLAENQFVYSENIDIYRDPRKIQLAVKPESFLTWMPWLALIMAEERSIDANSRETYYCMENKDIIDWELDMRFEGSVLRPKWPGAPIADSSGNWRAFLQLWVNQPMFFFDYEGWILVPNYVWPPASDPQWYRIDGTKDWTNYAFDIVFDTTGTTLSQYWRQRPVYFIWGSYFFADDSDHRNIVRTSNTWWMPGYASGHKFWPGYPTLTAYSQGISQPGDTVFASVHSDSVWTIGNSSVSLSSEMSAVSVVAGVASTWVKQLQTNVPIKFLHGVNKNNQDILIAGNIKESIDYPGGTTETVEYSSIYVYQWLGFWVGSTPLMAKSRYHQNIATAFDHHWITYYLVGTYGLTDYNWAAINDLVYCISNKDNVGLIYAFGKSVWGVNDGWSVVVSTNSQGKKMKRIGCLYRNYAKNGFYYTYEDVDGLFWVDYYDDISIDNPTSFQPSGKIFLRTDDGWDVSLKKEVGLLKVGCEVPADTSIEISYILDDGAEVTYETITPTTQGSSAYKSYKGNKPIKWFQKISWFATLNTTGTNTPSISNFNYDIRAIQV